MHMISLRLCVFALISMLLAGCASTTAPQTAEFVQRDGASLVVGQQPFRFAGTNNYYLMYKSKTMVDDVLETAAANNFGVVRHWGSIEIGEQDGSGSVDGIKDGVYFQYFDGQVPRYNDGPDGLERLDYVVYRAGQLKLRLIIPLVNNWKAFGGIDQYVKWRGGTYHDEFYTDTTIRGWYQDWIAHLLNRVNSYTGVAYKDDPAIMAWELANEPRCKGDTYPASPSCSTETLLAWVDHMSTFIKSVDPKHLVATGDEGFYCMSGQFDWTMNCSEGVDALAFAALPAIDWVSLHLYPDNWQKSPEWGTQWIEQHLKDARGLGKPAIVGEFGLKDAAGDKATRDRIYAEWTAAIERNGGAGSMFWILSGKQDDGALYPDYDGFTVYCPSATCELLSRHAREMADSGP